MGNAQRFVLKTDNVSEALVPAGNRTPDRIPAPLRHCITPKQSQTSDNTPSSSQVGSIKLSLIRVFRKTHHCTSLYKLEFNTL